MTYECSICKAVNHISRLQCQNCGTIPKYYSALGVPINGRSGLRVVVAFGSERQEGRRMVRKNGFKTEGV